MQLDTAEVIERAAQILAEKAWAQIEKEVASVTCISIERAAAALDMPAQKVRRLLKEHVDFGNKAMRVSVEQLTNLIKARTVKTK